MVRGMILGEEMGRRRQLDLRVGRLGRSRACGPQGAHKLESAGICASVVAGRLPPILNSFKYLRHEMVSAELGGMRTLSVGVGGSVGPRPNAAAAEQAGGYGSHKLVSAAKCASSVGRLPVIGLSRNCLQRSDGKGMSGSWFEMRRRGRRRQPGRARAAAAAAAGQAGRSGSHRAWSEVNCPSSVGRLPEMAL